MFERYTEKARRIIFFGRYEASQFGSSYIEVEHLMLAILRENRALLAGFAYSGDLESEIRGALPVREKISTSVDLPLSHSAKRVLAYGSEEAERLGQQHIGPEHLFLGILRESGTVAEQILRRHTITLEQARANAVGGNGPIISALRKTFAPMASRLTPDVEPAVIFSFRPGDAE